MKLRSLLLLSPLLGLGVVLWVSREAGLSLGGLTSQVPWETHLLVAGVWILSLTGRGARIALLARGLGGRLSLSSAMTTQLLGEGAGAATPSRSGSDPARLLNLRRLGVDVPTGIAVLVGEIMAEGIVLGGVVLALLFLLPDSRGVALGALPYSLAALAMPFLAVLLARLPARRMPYRLLRFLGRREDLWRRVRVGGRRFRLKARALTRLETKTMMAVILVSSVHLLARLSVLPLLVAGIGLEVSWGPLVAWPLLLLYTGSLLPPPGGGGAVELAFTVALGGSLGATALAPALLWWRFYTFYLGAALGGLILFLTLGRVGISTVGLQRRRAQVPQEAAPPGPGRKRRTSGKRREENASSPVST